MFGCLNLVAWCWRLMSSSIDFRSSLPLAELVNPWRGYGSSPARNLTELPKMTRQQHGLCKHNATHTHRRTFEACPCAPEKGSRWYVFFFIIVSRLRFSFSLCHPSYGYIFDWLCQQQQQKSKKQNIAPPKKSVMRSMWNRSKHTHTPEIGAFRRHQCGYRSHHELIYPHVCVCIWLVRLNATTLTQQSIDPYIFAPYGDRRRALFFVCILHVWCFIWSPR